MHGCMWTWLCATLRTSLLEPWLWKAKSQHPRDKTINTSKNNLYWWQCMSFNLWRVQSLPLGWDTRGPNLSNTAQTTFSSLRLWEEFLHSMLEVSMWTKKVDSVRNCVQGLKLKIDVLCIQEHKLWNDKVDRNNKMLQEVIHFGHWRLALRATSHTSQEPWLWNFESPKESV